MVCGHLARKGQISILDDKIFHSSDMATTFLEYLCMYLFIYFVIYDLINRKHNKILCLGSRQQIQKCVVALPEGLFWLQRVVVVNYFPTISFRRALQEQISHLPGTVFTGMDRYIYTCWQEPGDIGWIDLKEKLFPAVNETRCSQVKSRVSWCCHVAHWGHSFWTADPAHSHHH